MSTEQKIMSAVVQADIFLVDCWKYLLIILAMFGLVVLAYIHSGKY